MLLILFKINDYSFGIDADKIVSVIPSIDLKPILDIPNFIAGFFDFHGKLVPVIDVKMLTVQQPCQHRLSTRITLINYETRIYEKYLLGIMAENMTDLVEIDDKEFKDIAINTSKHLQMGKVFEHDGRIVQCVDFYRVIPEDLEKKLFYELGTKRPLST